MLSNKERLKAVEKIVGVQFRNRALLQEALTHRSFLNETKEAGMDHNERLEFLGDAVLGYIVCSYLYRQQPPLSEGQMTELKSALVSSKTLAQLGEQLNLGQFIYLAKGEFQDFLGMSKARGFIIANAVEGVIGAIAVDRGIGTAELFILEFVLPRLRQILASKAHLNPKTELQELAQKRDGTTPHYRELSQIGPEHEPTFVIAVYFGERQISAGWGSSKQEAEVAAARKALQVEFGVALSE